MNRDRIAGPMITLLFALAIAAQTKLFSFFGVGACAIFSTLQSVQNPWAYWPPPLQMTRNPNQFPIFGFKWNASLP